MSRPGSDRPAPPLPTERLPRPLLLALIAAAIVAAWVLRFAQDDAFISFHYARNLVEGEGLTWFGTRVEGYTNFLWVLWIALGLVLGATATAWSYLGGLLAWAAALWATVRLARRLSPHAGTAVLALLLVATNYTFVRYATGGLETMAQTALLAAGAVLALELRNPDARHRTRQAALLSVLCAAALLTRLDSAVAVGPIGLIALVGLCRSGKPVFGLVALLGPALVIVGVWLLWKASYYGRLLPNTFYAKVGDHLSSNGVVYVARFVHWYWLWPVAAVATLAALVRWRANPALWLCGGLVTVWLGYVIWVGGDFMEFRFLVPIAPIGGAVLATLIHDALGARWVGRPRLVSAVALTILIAGSVTHATRPWRTTDDKALDSIPQLAECYGLVPDGDWPALGNALATRLAGLDVTLAMHPVGAIPYYSRIPTVDMWGLNDRDIALHGNRVPADFARPGHRRHASLAQLRARGVTFVLGHPTLVPRGTLADPRTIPQARLFVRDAIRFETAPIDRVTLVEIPIDDRRAVVAWYLTPQPAVDAALAERRWVISAFEMGR